MEPARGAGGWPFGSAKPVVEGRDLHYCLSLREVNDERMWLCIRYFH